MRGRKESSEGEMVEFERMVVKWNDTGKGKYGRVSDGDGT